MDGSYATAADPITHYPLLKDMPADANRSVVIGQGGSLATDLPYRGA